MRRQDCKFKIDKLDKFRNRLDIMFLRPRDGLVTFPGCFGPASLSPDSETGFLRSVKFG